MCGIAGFFDPIPDPTTRRALLEVMLSALVHRGPDDYGIWLQGAVALGHRRLSIVDLSPTGHQPMASPRERYVAAFNGEIYNHHELRAELEHTGQQFRGHSDTEVLLALIEAVGIEEALRRCVGMFALAIWDRRERVLMLARDRFGEKPLYFGWAGPALLFGSELKALTSHPRFDSALCSTAVLDVLRQGYTGPARSIYRAVRQVAPGTVLRFTAGADGLMPRDPREICYWDPVAEAQAGSREPFTGTMNDAVDVLEQHLRSSISGQLRADVPVGAFLSGGVDSSLVTALMQAESSTPVRSYTIGFHRDRYNEGDHAKAVAAHLGTDHTEWYVDESEALAIVPTLHAIYDEPFADSSQIPTLVLARLVRHDVTVALSGDGADEVFGGYPKYLRGHRLAHTPGRRSLARLARSINRWGARPLRRLLPDDVARRVPWHRLDTAAALYGARSISDIARGVGTLNHQPAKYLARGLLDGTTYDEEMSVPEVGSYRRTAMLADSIGYLPGDILTKVDRATMAASLESRAPFLDHRIYRFAASLPDTYLFDEQQGKRVLRMLLYRHVPRTLVDRPKAGFQVPLGEWLRGSLKEWAFDTLRAAGVADVLAVDQCSALLELHTRSTHDLSARIWPLLCLASWAGSRKIQASRATSS